MKTKLHLIIMSLVLLFVAGGQSVCLAAESWSYPSSKPVTPFGGGKGSKSNPYIISTAQHLANLAYMVTDNNTEYKNKYFILTNDITLNDDVINADGTGLKNSESSYKLWTPIGEYGFTADDDFMGTFDGQGHTIRGMVCIDTTGKRDYNGLFGTTDQATIMNLNLEDCYVGASSVLIDGHKSGVLSGSATKSSFINCHVSNSVVDVNCTYASSPMFRIAYVGGMIGSCDVFRSEFIVRWTRMTNCSYYGNVYAKANGKNAFLYVGGLFGRQLTPGHFKLNLTNCHTKGDISIKCINEVYELGVGGLTSAYDSGESELKGCVNRMNITIDSGDNTIKKCLVSGFGEIRDSFKHKVYQCANYGNVKIGSATKKANITNLYVNGIQNKRGNLSCCAFYGKFDIHSKGEYASISSLTERLCVENNVSSIVYSVGNVIDLDYKETALDQVSVQTFRLDEKKNEEYTKHRVYYHFENTGNVTFHCNGTEDASKYNKTLAELKADNFVTTLNTAAGSNVWGKVTGMSDELNGLPLPVACGGNVRGLLGQGTESAPFYITCEAELRALQKGIADGTRKTDSVFFQLLNDIDMSSVPMPSIGTRDYPFKGIFDGGGYAIVGMVAENGYLFDYFAGTLKDLALVDFKAADGVDDVAPLARIVGGKYEEASGVTEDHTGIIEKCYVAGDLKITPKTVSGRYYDGTIRGICGTVFEQGKVNNCYFKGSLEVAESADGSKPVAVFGGTGSVYGEVSNCYASYTLEKNNNTNVSYSGFSSTAQSGPRIITDCYYVCPQSTSSDKLSSEAELNEKFSGNLDWCEGLYRPVLTYTKSYGVELPDGGHSSIDAVPERNPRKNYIMNAVVSNEVYSDKAVWKLPNVAVYVRSEQVDYIPNGYLDQSSEFKYRRTPGATATLGQLHFALIQNDKGTHFVCLPGDVLKSDLPEGSDAMIAGKVTIVNDEEQVNVVHVDTIPAGVPCLLYVPVSSVQSGEEIDILMRSGIVNEPVMNADYSSLKGTFTPQTVSEDACMDVAKGTAARAATRSAAQDDTYYFIRGNEGTQVKPFSSWLEGSLGNVRIVDYMLLDEYNNTNVELIESSTDDVNIKLRLTMDADKWTTICLPFDMSTEEIVEKFGEDTKLEEVESISYEGSTLNIKLQEATDGIVSGSPYFIKPSVSNSIFDLGPRILSNELTYVGNLALSPNANQEISLEMSGWFDVAMLRSAEEYNAYYFNDGTLCQLPREYPLILGGFRCWFKASDSTASAPAELSSVIITHSDGTAADISVVTTDSQSTKQNIYDLRGIEKKTEKGIYIKGGKVRIKN